MLAALCAAASLQMAAAATYRMTIKSTPEAGSKCVSSPTGPFVEGMRVFIWDCGPQLAQTLVYDDQTQQLKFGANCVEVLGQGNPQDAISVGTCNGAVTQRWSMIATRDVYEIIGVNGLCLDISNGVIANGTPLDLVKCTTSNAVLLWVLFQAADMPTVAAAPAAPALPVIALPTIFDRHGLLGTFAEDCANDPSDTNPYIVHRALDAEHVERDQMKSRTVRAYAALVDSADEVAANEVGMNMVIVETTILQLKDLRMRLVTRIDGNRVRLMQSGVLSGPNAGQNNIVGGKTTSGGTETHWLSKCP
jgi:Ricin-type beta-trefoil lectin domain